MNHQHWNRKPKHRKAPWKSFTTLKGGKPLAPMRQKPKFIRRISRRQSKRNARYYKIRAAFLALPENQWCHVCAVLVAEFKATDIRKATEVHHRKGRAGNLLYMTEFFTPTCWHCGRLVHQEVEWATRNGFFESWHNTKDNNNGKK